MIYFNNTTFNNPSGLDQEKVTLFLQSDIHEHAELGWMLTCHSYMGELQRMTQYKDKVAKGDAVLILEAMKMEIPVVAPEDGTVASIDVAVGDPIESGAVLATLN